ncbi:MAG TPA: PAS domain S-box protein [Verrucomicrobiales bacterium]|nr:PAS domain S-box protein [Verrucomicrobiales bacterium]
MTDYARMTKAELIERLETLEGKDWRPRKQKATGPPSKGIEVESDPLENEERLRAILETAVEGIITINQRGIIESFNSAAERIFGYGAAEIIGKNIKVLMPTPYREEHDGYLANYLRTGETKIIGIGRQVEGRRKNGEVFPTELSVSEVCLRDKHLFTGFVRDVSERVKAEVKLIESEERYRLLVETTNDLIQSVKPDGQFEFVNRAWLDALGYTSEQVIGLNLFDIVHPDGQPFWREMFSKVLNRKTLRNIETTLMTVTGVPIVVEGNVTGKFIDEQLTAIHGFFRDITERRELEKEILEIRHGEQQRIGQELHDNLGQQLTGIEFMSQTLEQQLTAESNPHASNASTITGLVREAISQTRGLSQGLNPVVHEMEGLMTALEELTEHTGKLSNIDCVFCCDSPVSIGDNSAATHLFRIAQEAVNNAFKHGKPTKIIIELSDNGQSIALAVKDDGKGLPKRFISKGGMGLKIMQYRAGLIGGSLVVQKRVKGGTEVVCTLNRKKL